MGLVTAFTGLANSPALESPAPKSETAPRPPTSPSLLTAPPAPPNATLASAKNPIGS